MRVFRVEDWEGGGPYMFAGERPHATGKLELMPYVHKAPEHPSPQTEGIATTYSMENYYCGFESLDKMKVWFKNFETALFESYMDVTEWEVEKEFIKFGKKQLIFQKRYARLITRTSYPTN